MINETKKSIHKIISELSILKYKHYLKNIVNANKAKDNLYKYIILPKNYIWTLNSKW